MDITQATPLFEALASPVRLSIFRLLVRHGETGIVAGDIAVAVNVSTTNLSFHLKNLLHAGLVSVEQEGRFSRYRANIPLMLDVVAFLTEECCAGDPGKCVEYRQKSAVDKAIFDACECGKKK